MYGGIGGIMLGKGKSDPCSYDIYNVNAMRDSGADVMHKAYREFKLTSIVTKLRLRQNLVNRLV
jgi:hypothetical protein